MPIQQIYCRENFAVLLAVKAICSSYAGFLNVWYFTECSFNHLISHVLRFLNLQL